MDLSDFTPSGRINQWTLIDGHPRCVFDALPATDAGALVALQTNAAVHSLIGKADAYEAAQRLVVRYAGEDVEQPEPTITTSGLDSEETTVANPTYVELEDARALVAGADAVTLALAILRSIEELDNESNPAFEAWTAAQETVAAELARLSAEPLASDPRPVPAKVAIWRAKAVLQEDGLLIAADAAIAAANNPALSAFWGGGGSEVYRSSPSVIGLAVGLSLTDAQVDDLFRRADALPAL